MRRPSILVFLLIVFGATTTTIGQSCELNLIGSWKTVDGEYEQPLVYQFASGGRVTVLAASEQPRVLASATYELDNPKSPKVVTFTATSKTSVFAVGKTEMKIVAYDDTSMTCEMPGIGSTRWVKVDPHRYFLILAARKGEFYDLSGPAVQILIKTVGGSQIDAVGTYSDRGKAAFGKVPPEAYKDYLREARGDSEVMLRLEINSGQYERGLKILQTWDRRARHDELLYQKGSALNNVLLVKAVTETLNQCADIIPMYKLNYIHPEDWISNEYGSEFIPFFYFKELRRLNEARHVQDDKFQQAWLASGSTPGR